MFRNCNALLEIHLQDEIAEKKGTGGFVRLYHIILDLDTNT